MSLGKGGIYGTSARQKIVTKSSTKAELVGVSDVLPQVVWTRNFLLAQGYDVRDSLVHQDNKSAILLEQNGRGSSSKRTRHIDIWYFFVTDRIAGKEVSVTYCPTGEMISDFFTKPLQGALFRKFRNLIMNNDPHTVKNEDRRSVLDEPAPGTNQVPNSTQGIRGNTVPLTYRSPVVCPRTGPVMQHESGCSKPVG
jgi:hypothetical protein